MPAKLWRTELVVWTDYDPEADEAPALVRRALEGGKTPAGSRRAFLADRTTEVVTDRSRHPSRDAWRVRLLRRAT